MAILLSASGTFRGRDPWVTWRDGTFYHCFSLNDTICIARSPTPEGLKDAPAECVYTPEPGKPWSKHLWAPELHFLDGKCYIYLACDDGDDKTHRIYVLENGSADPMAAYTLHGRIEDGIDAWAIDGTLLELDGNRYLVWSARESDSAQYRKAAQNLYIAKMSDPFTLATERRLISSPDEPWEQKGADERHPYINEGPCVLQRHGKTYILYSASYTGCDDYCIGMLTYLGGDPMRREAWKKSDGPVFARSDTVRGPGHCSVASDGVSDYLCYHAFDSDCSGGLKSAHAVAQRFTWNGDTPVFGEPELPK